MSTATKQRHRQTPTQLLHAQIAELQAQLRQQTTGGPAAEQELERLAGENDRLTTALQDLAAHLSSVTEHAFSLGRKDAGDLERRVARRRELTSQWGVFDGPAGVRFWGADHMWHQTFLAPAEAVYAWPEADARRLARMLAGQAPLPGEELDTAYLESQFIRIEEPAPAVEATPVVVTLTEAKRAPVTAGRRHAKQANPGAPSDWLAKAEALAEEPLTLAQVEAAQAKHRANVAVLKGFAEKRPVEPATPAKMPLTAKDAEAGIAAARDDVDTLRAVIAGLTNLDIDADAEQPDAETTQLLDVADLRDLTGNGDTQLIPIVAEVEVEPTPDIPPMPTSKPLVCPADHTIRHGITVRIPRFRRAT